MKSNVRRVTNDVISAVEDGFLDWETVARTCLDYMSEDEVADMADINDWAIADDEDIEEDDSLSEETLDKIWEIAERYNTSSPVSGNWDTEILHERDAIVKEVGLTKKEANEVMVEYLGFDTLDIEIAERKFGEKVSNESLITEEVCPDCGKEVGKDGHCYNQECVAYDPTAQYFEDDVASNDEILFKDKDADENALVENNYDSLNFYEEGLLIGDIGLEYTDLPVMDQFDNDIEVAHVFYVFISPDLVLDFICSNFGVNKKELTVKQAQKYLDELAKNPKDFYSYLQEYFVEEATEEAQQEVAADGIH